MTNEAAGLSLLDHSLLVYGSPLSDGNMHLYRDLPVLLIAGAAALIFWLLGDNSPFKAATPTPTGTTTATDTSTWNTYQNVKYGFHFKFPPGSSIASQSDNAGRVYLPFAPATNLVQKYVDVNVVEDATQCKSPATTQMATSENVTINGIPFLKETGAEGATGNYYDWIGYSTQKGTDCISLTFVLHSTNPGVYPTPPPLFDATAESAVFGTIMSTFATQ